MEYGNLMTPSELNVLVSTLVMKEPVVLLSDFAMKHDLPELAAAAKEEDALILTTGKPVPNYCGHMEQAFYVVAAMRVKGYMWTGLWEPNKMAVCSFVKAQLQPLLQTLNRPKQEKEYLFTGETPMIAICLAAVAALGQPNLIHQQ